MSRANDSAYDSAFTDSEAGTLSDIMSDFDLAASINGAVSLNGIDELRELKEGFHFCFSREHHDRAHGTDLVRRRRPSSSHDP